MNGDGDANSSAIAADQVVQPVLSLATSATSAPLNATDSPLQDTGDQSMHASTSENSPPDQRPKDLLSNLAELQGRESVTIELMDEPEMYPDLTAGSGDVTGTSEEGQEWQPEGEHELKRVKVSLSLPLGLLFLDHFRKMWRSPILGVYCDQPLLS